MGRRRRISAILLLAATSLMAQSFEKLLPKGAVVIESADVSGIAQKPRVLVLWMLNPQKRNGGPEYCGTVVDGDYWVGQTKLSLVDPAGKLISTVNIADVPRYDGSGKPFDVGDFHLPFYISDDYYYVPKKDAKGRGNPQLLRLRDFTGEGASAQFAMFTYQACGIADTSVFGYSASYDRAVQYSVLVRGNDGKTTIEQWVEQIFAKKPVRPGYWKFTWRPGHGSDDEIHEEVSFDRAKQQFVDRQTITVVK